MRRLITSEFLKSLLRSKIPLISLFKRDSAPRRDTTLYTLVRGVLAVRAAQLGGKLRRPLFCTKKCDADVRDASQDSVRGMNRRLDRLRHVDQRGVLSACGEGRIR